MHKAIIFSLSINFAFIYLYVKFVMPIINEAAKGIATMMLGK